MSFEDDEAVSCAICHQLQKSYDERKVGKNEKAE